jgi:two-component system sensor kinase FixL
LEAFTEANAPRREIQISARAIDGIVEIDVADTGPGISDDMVDAIFLPFVTGKSQNMGLGLAIGRTMIEAHGGRLSYRRREGGGSVFNIILPVMDHDSN